MDRGEYFHRSTRVVRPEIELKPGAAKLKEQGGRRRRRREAYGE